MKKNLLTVLIIALTAMLAVSCATTATEATAPSVVVLNNALKTLETSDQCFNATGYVPCYSVEEIIADNFWFMPTDETFVTCFQNNDFGYADTITYGGQAGHKTAYMAFGFHNRFVTFAGSYTKADPEDFYVGKGGNYTYRAYYTTISVIGNEALVFMQPDFWTDGIPVEDIIVSVKNSTINNAMPQAVVEADSWKFTAVDGKELVLTKAEFEAAVLYSNADQSLIWVESGAKKLENIRYFAPETLTKKSVVESDKVYRFTIVKNAVGVYGVEAPYSQNVAGTYYPTAKTLAATDLAGSYSIADLLAAYNVAEGTAVKVVSEDGSSLEYTWEDAQKVYFAYHLTNGYTIVGPTQIKGQPTVNKIAYIVAGETVYAFVAEDGSFVSDFADVAELTGVTAKLVYTDGSEFAIPYDIAKDVCLTTDSKLLTVNLF